MPLFHTLKGCIEKRNFQEMSAAETTHQQIKEALHKLPTLASPIPGETLQVYLSASNEAISLVLVVEKEWKQTPVYFVSRGLQGPKTNYHILERLVVTLIYAMWRLRWYSSHILIKPEKFGHLEKWAIELGEHDISYRLCTNIKGNTFNTTCRSWMTSIIEYVQHDILPNTHEEARKVRIKAPLYTIIEWVLYRK